MDPIDGTTLTAKGMSNAVAVLAVAPRGSMYDPSAVFYMEKLVTGPGGGRRRRHPLPGRGEHPPGRQGQGHQPEDVTVVLLDRPRHEELAEEIRATGARIKFIVDGDVAGAISAARPGSGVDLLLASAARRRGSSRPAR